MGEKKSFHGVDDESDEESQFVGEIRPEVDGYRGNGLYITDVHRKDLLSPKELDRGFKMVEEYLSKGVRIADLIANKIVADPTFVSLFHEYDEGKREDPNNYKKKIKDYYAGLSQKLK